MRATILAATYNEAEDTVTIQYRDEDQSEALYMHWPRSEFGPQMQIKREFIPPGGIPVKMLIGDPENDVPNFLASLVGKTFEHIRVYVSVDNPLGDEDFDKMKSEAHSFRNGLYSGQYRPSVRPDRTK